jgi:hypothetical protein
MIDRPARDWMANLIDRTLAGEFDPLSGKSFAELQTQRQKQNPSRP